MTLPDLWQSGLIIPFQFMNQCYHSSSEASVCSPNVISIKLANLNKYRVRNCRKNYSWHFMKWKSMISMTFLEFSITPSSICQSIGQSFGPFHVLQNDLINFGNFIKCEVMIFLSYSKLIVTSSVPLSVHIAFFSADVQFCTISDLL